MTQQTDIKRSLATVYARLEILANHACGLPLRGRTLLDETLKQLAKSLEDLRAGKGKLARRDVALAASRRIVAWERQRCRDLFDLAPDACVITLPTGRIKEANRAAGRLFGSKQTESGR
jgi:PAS domain-containing protein